jgi:predicted RNA-binding Zn-ribbon protein involved in translation (DUF1610 family)
MKQTHVYKIDLTKIDGSGDFSCPRCGNIISPDDTKEKSYSILEPRVNSQGLEEVIIRCNRCESFIHLTGFTLLEKLSAPDAEKPESEGKEEPFYYIAHV